MEKWNVVQFDFHCHQIPDFYKICKSTVHCIIHFIIYISHNFTQYSKKIHLFSIGLPGIHRYLNSAQTWCVFKFCYLGDTLVSGGGVVEAAKAKVRCAWAKFKELSPILTVRDALYCIKGRIYSACVQSVLIYGTQTWAMKADDLRSLKRTKCMMVRRWDGCVRCPWKTEITVRIYAAFLVWIVLLMWWGVED